VQIEANGIVFLEVKNVVLATAGFGATVTLKNTHSTDSAVIAAQNRLILLTNRPKIYDDPAAAAAAPGSSQTTAGSDGRALGYLREYRFDYIVTIDATTSRVFVDDEGSFVMR